MGVKAGMDGKTMKKMFSKKSGSAPKQGKLYDAGEPDADDKPIKANKSVKGKKKPVLKGGKKMNFAKKLSK